VDLPTLKQNAGDETYDECKATHRLLGQHDVNQLNEKSAEAEASSQTAIRNETDGASDNSYTQIRQSSKEVILNSISESSDQLAIEDQTNLEIDPECNPIQLSQRMGATQMSKLDQVATENELIVEPGIASTPVCQSYQHPKLTSMSDDDEPRKTSWTVQQIPTRSLRLNRRIKPRLATR
jgi:hypothetical protein